jgi:hypothetical protein
MERKNVRSQKTGKGLGIQGSNGVRVTGFRHEKEKCEVRENREGYWVTEAGFRHGGK